MRERSPVPAIAAAVVALMLLALWLGFGVSAWEAARFVGYELFYLALPGLLLVRLLLPGSSSLLRRGVLALALGQVVAVLAFALTAGIGARWLFALYPLVFLLLAVAQRARRSPAPRHQGPWEGWRVEPARLPAWSLALAGACVLSLAGLTLTHFLAVPLPGQVNGSFTYEHDYLFHLSLAAEALRHWPLGDPNVAATALPYHWFSYLHIAAIGQVTGIPLPTVYLALFQAPLLLLLLCELALAGENLGGVAWAGPLAALMLMFVGEIDLAKPEIAPFLDVMATYLRYSPSFLFAATTFVPLLILVCEALQTERPSRGQWGAIALLAVGCAGGEVASLPLVLGGVGSYFVYRWLTARRWERRAVQVGLLLGGVLLAAGLFLYGGGGGGAGGLTLGFPAGVHSAPPFVYELPLVPNGLHGAYWALATILLAVFLLGAPAAGLPWLPRRLSRLRAQEVVPLTVFALGVFALAFLRQESGSQEYLVMFGVIALLPLSAGGLIRLLARWRRSPGSSPWPPLALGCVCLVGSWMFVFSPALGNAASVDTRYQLTYGIAIAVFLALTAFALLSPPPLRARRAIYPVIAVLAAALVNLPSDYRSRFGDLVSGSYVQAEEGPGLTPALYRGLLWIRANTPTDAVLAVDNLRTPATRTHAPLYFYVAAFAERRTLLQGWEYTTRGAELGFTAVGALEAQPFPERMRLQNAVFDRASLPALRQLQHRFGVTDLVVSRTTGTMTPALRRITRLTYSNPELLVLIPRGG